MSLIGLAERGWLPDWMIRLGMRRMLAERLRQERLALSKLGGAAAFAEQMRQAPIALATDQANAQHYEVPAEFFALMLGPRLKYSSCLYADERTTLAQAEESMLDLTCRRAEIEDGMDVLDLGCGWGSLSLWIAERYPRCRVTSLSNSSGQRRHIEARCQAKGLHNVRVLTANIADFAGAGSFDRIVSVEMFEHMRNYEALLERIASWLRPDGKLFVHIFCHRDLPYTFEAAGDDDWMARHFFTGGIMPSFDLLGRFSRDLQVRRRWQIDGSHYARTCAHWLANLDANLAQVRRVFAKHYPSAEAMVVVQRWRMFVMACAELFAYRGGSEWFVGHYLLEPSRAKSPTSGGEAQENWLVAEVV